MQELSAWMTAAAQLLASDAELEIDALCALAAEVRAGAAESEQEAITEAFAPFFALARRESERRLEMEAARAQVDRRIREVTTVYEIAHALDKVEIDRLLAMITEKAAAVMDAQACSLILREPESDELRIEASFGLDSEVVENTRILVGEGIAGRVVATGNPLRLDGPALGNGGNVSGVASSLCMPMKDESGNVLGVLCIRRRAPAPSFADEDVRLFSIFAAQAGLAINNAQLYAQLNHRLEELRTVSKLTETINSTLDLDDVLAQVADSIVEVVHFDRCRIYLCGPETGEFAPRIVRGFRPGPREAGAALGEGVVGGVAQRQKSLLADDLADADPALCDYAARLGMASFYAQPIVAQGLCIGVVVVSNNDAGRSITPSSVTLLSTFVHQAGIAIENARRYALLERRTAETGNILRSIAAGVIALNKNGFIVTWNPRAEEILSLSAAEMVGCHYSEFVRLLQADEMAREETMRMLELAADAGRVVTGLKMRYQSAPGDEIYVTLSASQLKGETGDYLGLVVVFEDVTKETQMKEELERVNRLAETGQMAANIAHELRNPLSSIKGAAQLLRNEMDTDDLAPHAEFLDIIIEEVNGLNRMTSEFLEFSRVTPPQMQTAALNILLTRLLQFMGAYLTERRVSLCLDLDTALPEVYLDKMQIEQVVKNIVINAVQAMPQGGTLTVATRHLESSRMVEICFTDTGIGIPANKLPKIFAPFFTTKTKGTGLGLPIARKIVETHGGRLDARSEPGVGATFTLFLPVSPVYAALPLPARAEITEQRHERAGRTFMENNGRL